VLACDTSDQLLHFAQSVTAKLSIETVINYARDLSGKISATEGLSDSLTALVKQVNRTVFHTILMLSVKINYLCCAKKQFHYLHLFIIPHFRQIKFHLPLLDLYVVDSASRIFTLVVSI